MKTSGRSSVAPQPGTVAVELECVGRCEGTVLVRRDMVDGWRCHRGHQGSPTGRSVTLIEDGALPADWKQR